jgi:hypothetical protein
MITNAVPARQTRVGADQVGLDADRADPHDTVRNPGRSIAYLVKKFTSQR